MVYSIPCGECNAVYVGETGRSLEVRMREHQRHTKDARIERSAVAEHAHECGHVVKWDAAAVLAGASGWHERKVKESIFIHKQVKKHLLMNKDSGWHLSDNWHEVL